MVVLVILSNAPVNEDRLSEHTQCLFKQRVMIHLYKTRKILTQLISKLPYISVFVFVGRTAVTEVLIPRMASSPLCRMLESSNYSTIHYEHYEDYFFNANGKKCLSVAICNLELLMNITSISIGEEFIVTENDIPLSESLQPVDNNAYALIKESLQLVFLSASWKSYSELCLFFVSSYSTICLTVKNPKVPVLMGSDIMEPITSIPVLITGDTETPRFPRTVPSSMYFLHRPRYEYNQHYISDHVITERVLAFYNVAVGDVFIMNESRRFTRIGNTLVLDVQEIPEWLQTGDRRVFGSKPDQIKTLFSLLEIRYVDNALSYRFFPRGTLKTQPESERQMHPDDGDITLFLEKTIEMCDPDILLCRLPEGELEKLLPGGVGRVGSIGRLVSYAPENLETPSEFMDHICNIASFNGFIGDQLGCYHNRHIEPSLQFIARRSPEINGFLFLSITRSKDEASGDAGGLNFSYDKESKVLDNVWVVDYDSCFPSIIITHTIGPKLMRNGSILPCNPLLAMYCKKLIEIRKSSENSSYGNLYKLMSNVCYGWFYATFNDVGRRVAEESRNALIAATSFFESEKVTVLSGHTDSLFLQTTEDVHSLTDKLNHELGKKYGPNSVMHMSVKGNYKNFLSIHLNAWAANDGTVYKGIERKNMCGWTVEMIQPILRSRFRPEYSDALWLILKTRLHELSQYTIATLPADWFLFYEPEATVGISKNHMHQLFVAKNGSLSMGGKYKYAWVLNHSHSKLIVEPFTPQESNLKIDAVKMVSTDLRMLLTQILGTDKGQLEEILLSLPVAIFKRPGDTNHCVHCSSCYTQLKLISNEDVDSLRNTRNASICYKCKSK